jgi:ketosteroid isomerase-like protein
VELVRSLFAAWERGDFSSAEWADPELELVIADGPAPGKWTGLIGAARGLRELLSIGEQLGAKAEEIRELDDERLLVLGTLATGRARRSGLTFGSLRAEGAAVFCLRERKVTRVVMYFDRDRALADLDRVP